MTITNPSNYTKDTDSWVHGTFVVSLGDNGSGNPVDYNTYLAILQHNQLDSLYGLSPLVPALEPNMQNLLGRGTGANTGLPTYMAHSKCRDTTLGGNDAINCYYQYNETDDPPHPFTLPENHNLSSGMGRVYSETIDDYQQILYITFGLPVFNNLSSFYNDALNSEMADLVNKGTAGPTVLAKLQAMVQAGVTSLVNLPHLPWLYLKYAVFQDVTNVPITKYYDFSNRMDLYYKYVQTILTHLSVNMGFMNEAATAAASPTPTGTSIPTTTEAEALAASQITQGTNTIGVPSIFQTFHMDILQIMNRRASFMLSTGQVLAPSTMTTDQAMLAQTQAMTSQTPPSAAASPTAQAVANLTAAAATAGSSYQSFTNNLFMPLTQFSEGFVGTVYNALAYVGFRVEKSTDSSESVSNSIGTSEVAGFINSKSQAVRDAKFNAMYGKTGSATLDMIGDFLGKVANKTSAFIDNTAGTEGLTALATGSGMIDIPEVWKDSSMSKSYSFNLHLRSPYGDPLSVIQSLYTPLAMLLAAALPRSTGHASYSTPFICRAYCKGMFAVPLGMIESMSIKRGSDVNGWTYQRLPTAIDINFTIKDLSPCMYMGMADLTVQSGIGGLGEFDPTNLTDVWNGAFGGNGNFQEYLLTLSGMGLAERVTMLPQLKRKAKMLLQTLIDFRLNPFHWDSVLGNSFPVRLLSAIIPITRIPAVLTGQQSATSVTGIPNN